METLELSKDSARSYLKAAPVRIVDYGRAAQIQVLGLWWDMVRTDRADQVTSSRCTTFVNEHQVRAHFTDLERYGARLKHYAEEGIRQFAVIDSMTDG